MRRVGWDERGFCIEDLVHHHGHDHFLDRSIDFNRGLIFILHPRFCLLPEVGIAEEEVKGEDLFGFFSAGSAGEEHIHGKLERPDRLAPCCAVFRIEFLKPDPDTAVVETGLVIDDIRFPIPRFHPVDTSGEDDAAELSLHGDLRPVHDHVMALDERKLIPRHELLQLQTHLFLKEVGWTDQFIAVLLPEATVDGVIQTRFVQIRGCKPPVQDRLEELREDTVDEAPDIAIVEVVRRLPPLAKPKDVLVIEPDRAGKVSIELRRAEGLSAQKLHHLLRFRNRIGQRAHKADRIFGDVLKLRGKHFAGASFPAPDQLLHEPALLFPPRFRFGVKHVCFLRAANDEVKIILG